MASTGVELITVIIEGILTLLDVLCFVGDAYAWFNGRENRIARRTARRAGETPPPRDRWSRRVIVLTILVVVITAILLLRHFFGS